MKLRLRRQFLAPQPTQLFDHANFYSQFKRDLHRARNCVIIESPFIARRRYKKLLPALEILRTRGVSIWINTKNPDEHYDFYRIEALDVIENLQTLGVHVLYTTRLYRKTAIIDNTILWEGSLNILSFNDSAECMRRTTSTEQCNAMLRFTELHKWIDDTIRNRYE